MDYTTEHETELHETVMSSSSLPHTHKHTHTRFSLSCIIRPLILLSFIPYSLSFFISVFAWEKERVHNRLVRLCLNGMRKPENFLSSDFLQTIEGEDEQVCSCMCVSVWFYISVLTRCPHEDRNIRQFWLCGDVWPCPTSTMDFFFFLTKTCWNEG